MDETLKLEILPSGHVKFRRGDKEYNDKIKKVILPLVEGDKEVTQQLEDFFNGSEEDELLIGSEIFCG
jgi:hypothetical protein